MKNDHYNRVLLIAVALVAAVCVGLTREYYTLLRSRVPTDAVSFRQLESSIAKILSKEDLAEEENLRNELHTRATTERSVLVDLCRCLKSECDNVRLFTISVLLRCGSHASEVIPELERLVSDSREPSDIRSLAATALGHIGGLPAVRCLERFKTHPDSTIRGKAADSLAQIEAPANTEAVRSLVSFFDDEDPSVRAIARDAVEYSVRYCHTDATVILSEVAKSGTDRQASMSFRLLAVFGGKNLEPFSTRLESLLTHSDPVVREHTLATIGELRVCSDHLLASIGGLLDDSSASVRYEALVTLVKIGPAAHGVVHLLSKRLRDPDQAVRMKAAEAVGEIGVASDGLIDSLIEALFDSYPLVRCASVIALGKLGPAATKAAPTLTKLLEDPANDPLIIQRSLRQIGFQK